MSEETGSILFIGNHYQKPKGFTYIFDELAFRLRDEGWKTFFTSKYKSKILKMVDMLLTIIKKHHQYQVAEVDVFSGMAFRWAQLSTYLLHILRKPIILTLHGGNLPSYARKYKNRVNKVLDLGTTVVSSAYLYENLKHLRSDIEVIPNPVEIDHYNFRQRKFVSPRLVWLRAFHEIYNPSMAPRVIYELKEKYPDIVLYMVGPDKGDGSLEHMLEVAEELSVREKIILKGFIPRDHVADMLNDCDIFINTTNIDNTPISVIEAMACGLCVVSTNVGGIQYIVENGIDGLLTPPNDPVGMAASIKRILNNPMLAYKLSQNGRKKAQEFSWDLIFPLWKSLIRESIEIYDKTDR